MTQARMWPVLGALAAVIAMSVGARSAAAVSTGGLLAVWLCDEGQGAVAADSSGNGFDGAFVDSGGDPDWVDGKFGGGIQFDQAGWLETDRPVVVDTKGFSMGCWAKPGNEQTAWANIMSSHQEPPERGISFEQGQNSLNQYGVPIGAGGWMGCGGTFFRLQSGEWNHMVIVREDDGKLAQAYLNGVRFAQDQVCGNDENVVAATSNFRLGNWVLGSREWNGVIDEAFVFNRALSEAEVLSIYNAGWEGALSVSPRGKMATTWAEMKPRTQ